MTKQDTIEFLCQQARKVLDHYKAKYAADCFCSADSLPLLNYSFEGKISTFIQEAIDEKIAKEKE